MAAFALLDTKVFAGALDASCFADQITLEAMVDTVPKTTFCSSGWVELVPSLRGWSAQLEGPQDLAITTAANTLTPDEHYLLGVGTAYPLSAVAAGDAEAAVAYFSEGRLLGYTPVTGAVSDLARQMSNWSIVGYPLVRGLFATKQTVTVTGNGTGHNLGAVSAAQHVYGSVHFLTAGGTTPSITVVLESDDNSGFTTATTVATFTAATTRTAQITRVAGAITDTWWRYRWTVSGTSPSFQVRGFLGIQ